MTKRNETIPHAPKKLITCKSCFAFFYENSWRVAIPAVLKKNKEDEVCVLLTRCPHCRSSAEYKNKTSVFLKYGKRTAAKFAFLLFPALLFSIGIVNASEPEDRENSVGERSMHEYHALENTISFPEFTDRDKDPRDKDEKEIIADNSSPDEKPENPENYQEESRSKHRIINWLVSRLK